MAAAAFAVAECSALLTGADHAEELVEEGLEIR
jgi:hypothetical protein